MDILKDEAVIKEVIDDLIQTATTYDLNKLENIYHDDLSVIMIDVDDNLNTANKETFKGIFKRSINNYIKTVCDHSLLKN